MKPWRDNIRPHHVHIDILLPYFFFYVLNEHVSMLLLIIDREAREIMYLVASVRLSVRLSVWVYSGHIIHHYNGIWGTCAPGRRNMHHQGAICTTVHKGDYVFWKIQGTLINEKNREESLSARSICLCVDYVARMRSIGFWLADAFTKNPKITVKCLSKKRWCAEFYQVVSG